MGSLIGFMLDGTNEIVDGIQHFTITPQAYPYGTVWTAVVVVNTTELATPSKPNEIWDIPAGDEPTTRAAVERKMRSLLDLFKFPYPVAVTGIGDDNLPIQGIYLLWNKETEQLEYIGQSRQLYLRLCGHQVYNKERHHLEVIPIPPACPEQPKMAAVEAALIGLLEPTINRTWKR